MDTKGKQHASKGELIKWLGLRAHVAMAVEPKLSLCIGNIFMTKELFLVQLIMAIGLVCHVIAFRIYQCLEFCSTQVNTRASEGSLVPNAIRPFLEDFNATRYNNVTPGHHLTVDECMSAWNGSDGKYRHDGMPYKTKIPQKPEGVGAEMKSLCCGTTGIMLKLDIMDGKDRQAANFYAEYEEGTAIT